MKERRRVRAAPRSPAPRDVVGGRELTLEEEVLLMEQEHGVRKLLLRKFCKVSAGLVRAVGYDHVGVIAFLIDWDIRRGDPDNRGWFYLPYKTVARALGIDPRKVQREVRHYVDLGVLQRFMENRRPRPRQWLRVHYSALRDRAETPSGHDES